MNLLESTPVKSYRDGSWMYYEFEQPVTATLVSYKRAIEYCDSVDDWFGTKEIRRKVFENREHFGKEITVLGYIMGEGKMSLPPGKYYNVVNFENRWHEKFVEELIVLEDDLFEL